MNHGSIHNFKKEVPTIKSCELSAPETETLRKSVKRLAQAENRHPNSVWAELKRKFDFYSYKTADCQTVEKIKAYLDERLKAYNK